MSWRIARKALGVLLLSIYPLIILAVIGANLGWHGVAVALIGSVIMLAIVFAGYVGVRLLFDD